MRSQVVEEESAVLATELARTIESRIIFGELAPDARIVEDDVVREFGMSRSPVREAFRVLEAEGLILREKYKGVRVSPMRIEDLDEVYACRLPLEGLAAELAARNRTREHVASITQCFKDLEAVRAGRRPRAFFERNVALSDSIHTAAGSATLKRLLASVGKQSLRYRYFAYLSAPQMMDASIEANADILRAISSGRHRQARAATEDIIQQSWDVIRAQMRAAAPQQSK